MKRIRFFNFINFLKEKIEDDKFASNAMELSRAAGFGLLLLLFFLLK